MKPFLVDKRGVLPASVSFVRPVLPIELQTKEHILRQKWRRKDRLGEPGLRERGWHREASINGPLITIDNVHTTRPPFTCTASGVVCQDCNNGWMRSLEENVEPYLPALIEGRETGTRARCNQGHREVGS